MDIFFTINWYSSVWTNYFENIRNIFWAVNNFHLFNTLMRAWHSYHVTMLSWTDIDISRACLNAIYYPPNLCCVLHVSMSTLLVGMNITSIMWNIINKFSYTLCSGDRAFCIRNTKAMRICSIRVIMAYTTIAFQILVCAIVQFVIDTEYTNW